MKALEGEFEKRIKEEFEMQDVDAIYPINIQAEDILAIVDEAKKEIWQAYSEGLKDRAFLPLFVVLKKWFGENK